MSSAYAFFGLKRLAGNWFEFKNPLLEITSLVEIKCRATDEGKCRRLK